MIMLVPPCAYIDIYILLLDYLRKILSMIILGVVASCALCALRFSVDVQRRDENTFAMLQGRTL